MKLFQNRYILIGTQVVVILLLLIIIDIIFFSRPHLSSERNGYVGSETAEGLPPEDNLLPISLSLTVPTVDFVEIIDSCGPSFIGTCVSGYMHINNELTPIKQFRKGMVLRVGTSTVEIQGEAWYRIIFDEWVRYPERLTSELYVRAADVHHFSEQGSVELTEASTSTKRIIVDRGEQMLRAYDGDTLFMEATTSTGVDLTPTPRGTFTIYRKTPSRYMQGPIPGISIKEYDLPGVPWNLYFTEDGAVIHGAYWHNSFGTQWSNGCVNLPPPIAEILYKWADVGTTVIVRD